jgi:hypothetical protein
MNQIVELLQCIARTAYKTQETVKTLVLYLDTSNTSDIDYLYILLEAAKTNSIKSALEITTQTVNNKLGESFNKIKESVDSSDEIYTILKSSIPSSAPENLKHMLDANIQSLKSLMVQMNPLVAN